MVKLKTLIFPTLSYFLILCVTIWLGLWQMHRLEWKTELLNTLENRFSADPVSFSDDISNLKGKKFFLDTPDRYPDYYTQYEYKILSVRGKLLPSPLYYRVRHHKIIGKAYDVFAVVKLSLPFEGYLPVSLGSIPMKQKENFSFPTNERIFTGIFRLAYNDTQNVMPNALIGDTPYRSLSQKFQNDLYPFTLFLTQHNKAINMLDYYETKNFLSKIPNNHFMYMLTWFSFAMIATIFYGVWIKRHILCKI